MDSDAAAVANKDLDRFSTTKRKKKNHLSLPLRIDEARFFRAFSRIAIAQLIFFAGVLPLPSPSRPPTAFTDDFTTTSYIYRRPFSRSSRAPLVPFFDAVARFRKKAMWNISISSLCSPPSPPPFQDTSFICSYIYVMFNFVYSDAVTGLSVSLTLPPPPSSFPAPILFLDRANFTLSPALWCVLYKARARFYGSRVFGVGGQVGTSGEQRAYSNTFN